MKGREQLQLQTSYESAPVALCLIDRELRYVIVNARFASILGRPAYDIIGHRIDELPPLAVAGSDFARALIGEPMAERDFHIADTGQTLRISAELVRGAKGAVSGLSIALVDMTERTRIAGALDRAEQRATYALRTAGQWIWELDVPSNRVTRSPHWKEMLGYQSDENTVPDEELAWQIVHPGDRAAADRALKRVLRGERKTFEATYRILHKNGRWMWILSRGAVVDYAPDGSPLRFLATSVDITRQKHVEEELAATMRQRRVLEQELIRANRRLTALSEMDSLTELPNRRKFDKVLEREFRRTRRNQPSMALMMIDVDHFKNFNDLYGHQAGDECLRTVAEALRKTVQRSGDIVTRYGGEEFAAVLTDTDEAGALEVAARMLAGVRALACAHAGSAENIVTVSIGLTMFSLDASGQPPTPQHLLRAADRALYAAKEAGRDRIATARLDGDGTIRITVSQERAGGAPATSLPPGELPKFPT
jgi:diguanylate cyclase (GGDEF)-like protein/PAS domain S-box-containing protein